MIKPSVKETKWSCLLARTRVLTVYISIWIFDIGPVKLPGLSRNGPQGKLGSTETSSQYPCGNKIQDGILCCHCFEKFSAQWSWYQRYTHIRKVTCKKKGKCILLLFLAVINCDCSCRSNNFRQIETTTNQKPIDCEKQPCLRPLCYSSPSLEPKVLIS